MDTTGLLVVKPKFSYKWNCHKIVILAEADFCLCILLLGVVRLLREVPADPGGAHGRRVELADGG